MSKSQKEFMKRNCASGYEYHETKFYELTALLEENAAYSPFQFKNGVRGKDNIISGAKFVVLDVDKSTLTDKEAHLLLLEYNHHIARTSDPDNEYKFRVLIELDAVVDVDDRMWGVFLEEIGLLTGLVVDVLPRSQIYFSFANRRVFTQLEGEQMEIKPLLDRAAIRLRDKPKPAKEMAVAVKKQHLDDPRTTFDFAFMAEQGERSRLLYRALKYAGDIGADEEYIINLAKEINNYWVTPIAESRLKNTLIDPILRSL